MTDGHGPVVVVGAGGHAKVCVDVLEDAGHAIAGFVAPAPVDDLDGAYLGDDEWLDATIAGWAGSFFVAIGSNEVRARRQSQLERLGGRPATVISSAATVSRRASVGVGSIVMPGAVINTHTRVGRGVIVNTGATVDHDCVLGDWCHVAPGTHLAGTVRVGDGAFLGVGVAVVPGRSIGAWSVVGAGAVVVHDVAERTIAVGVPGTGAGEALAKASPVPSRLAGVPLRRAALRRGLSDR